MEWCEELEENTSQTFEGLYAFFKILRWLTWCTGVEKINVKGTELLRYSCMGISIVGVPGDNDCMEFAYTRNYCIVYVEMFS